MMYYREIFSDFRHLGTFSSCHNSKLCLLYSDIYTRTGVNKSSPPKNISSRKKKSSQNIYIHLSHYSHYKVSISRWQSENWLSALWTEMMAKPVFMFEKGTICCTAHQGNDYISISRLGLLRFWKEIIPLLLVTLSSTTEHLSLSTGSDLDPLSSMKARGGRSKQCDWLGRVVNGLDG